MGSVTADSGRDDLSHLVLHHESEATSTITVTQDATAAAEGFELYVWGDRGRSAPPEGLGQPVTALRTALDELAANGRAGRLAHPCDVHFGTAITHVLAEAERRIGLAPRRSASR